MVRSKHHRGFCYRWNFNLSIVWCYRNIEVNMIRITYGAGGYDPTKPNNNIVEEEWLPDPPPEPEEEN